MEKFEGKEGNDDNYLKWIRKNPEGYVLNILKYPNPGYDIIHRAKCRAISISIKGNKSNRWTTGINKKRCSMDKTELEETYQKEVGGKFKYCQICRP